MDRLLKELDLSLLEGCTVRRVETGDEEVFLHLETGDVVAIDGEWTFHHTRGIVDFHPGKGDRSALRRLRALAGREIARSRVDPLESCSLIFGDGTRLTVRESSNADEPLQVFPAAVGE